ncbi:MAG: flippase-like domain-containing protein [Gemmatimonadetes bacterium]|nr:flippase-like domain-containing protein [Gemmatimonadota bacterium]
MSARAAPRLVAVLKVVLTALVVALLVRFVGWRELAGTLAAANRPWLFAMYGTTIVTFSLTALSLFLLLRKTGLGVSYGRVVYANAVSSLYGLIVPGDLLAGLSKWAILSSSTGERARVLSAIVFNKVALAAALVLIGSLAFARENPFPEAPFTSVSYLAGLVLFGGTIAALHPRAGPAIDRVLLGVARPLPPFVKRPVESMIKSLQAFRSIGPAGHLQVVAVAATAVVLGFTGFACATRAVGAAVPLPALPWIALILFVSKALPLTMSNLGVREGILVLIFRYYDVAPATAAASGLLLFSNSVLIGLCGAVLQAVSADGTKKKKARVK